MKKQEVEKEIITLCDDNDTKRFNQVATLSKKLASMCKMGILKEGETYEIVVEEPAPRSLKDKIKKTPAQPAKAIKVKITRVVPSSGIIEGVIEGDKGIIIHTIDGVRTRIVGEDAQPNKIFSQLYNCNNKFKTIEREVFDKSQLAGDFYERTVHHKDTAVM